MQKEVIGFNGEIKSVSVKKLDSLDKEIRITINTNDIIALELGKIETDKMVKVLIGVIE